MTKKESSGIPVEVGSELLVGADRCAELEEADGPGGAWAEQVRRFPALFGATLPRAEERQDRYLTIDRWTSTADDDRRARDERCAARTRDGARVGLFREVIR